MATTFIKDAATGQSVLRELTAEELEALTEPEADRIARLNAEAQAKRRGAFQLEADPLFFAWQRGESTEQEWRDKCDEIRLRFPYV